jgi:hypothetical protein
MIRVDFELNANPSPPLQIRGPIWTRRSALQRSRVANIKPDEVEMKEYPD